jgi:NADH-quinone oxidoreductase subunit F
MKWQFVDKKIEPRYIACNADESEPGTFKDHLLIERNPHLLIEGCAIGCYAIGTKVTYIYIRGEFFHVQHVLEHAIDEAYARGFLGRNILGSGFDCDVYVHRGAGAYEAGEETALLESLEGKRAQPRNKPPFPAVVGLYGKPTAVNNVETLCNVPLIVAKGAESFAALGPEKNGGPKLYCVSGHVRRPGVYEASMSTTLREIIHGMAGGPRDGHRIKAVIPGGSSVPILLPEQLDIPASFDDVAKQLVLYDQRVEVEKGQPVPIKGEGEQVEFAKDEPLRLECKAFLQAIATRVPPVTDGRSGQRVLQVLGAAQRSLMLNGEPITLAAD